MLLVDSMIAAWSRLPVPARSGKESVQSEGER